MASTTYKLIAVFGSLMLLFSVFAGSAAAASWATTGDQQGTGATVQMDESATNTNHTAIITSATNNPHVMEIRDQQTGEVYFSDDSPENTATDEYTFTNSIASIAKELPREATSQGQYKVVIVDADGNDVLTDDLTGAFVGSNTEFHEVQVVAGSEAVAGTGTQSAYSVNSVAAQEDSGFSIPFFGSDSESETPVSVVSHSVDVTSNTDEVEIHLDDSTTATNFDSAAEDTEAGEWMVDVQSSSVNLGHYKTFDKNAPEGFDTSNTYATYDADTDVYTLHIGEDVDKSSITFNAVGNEDYGVFDRYSKFGDFGFSFPSFGSEA